MLSKHLTRMSKKNPAIYQKNSKKKAHTKKSISIQNRKALHDFFIKSRIESGIVLTGPEVKSLRSGHGNISNAYVIEKNKELMIQNFSIPLYKSAKLFANDSYNPNQTRKLLLHKKEILKCMNHISKKGMTIIPLSLYSNKRGIFKLEIGIAEGKKLHDKRQSIKERDWQREKDKIVKAMR